MNPQALLQLIVLFHLAGLMHQHAQANAQRPGTDKKPHQPLPGPNPTPTPSPKPTPQGQGFHGVTQGHNGSLAPILGGMGSALNQSALYPHQRNPLSFLGGK